MARIEPGNSDQISYPNFRDLRLDDALDGLAAYARTRLNLRSGDGVSAIAKVVSSRATDAEGVTDELALEEIVNEPASPNGGVKRG